MTPPQPFHRGDHVIFGPCTDCFGVHWPESGMMEVTRVQLVVCRSIPSYWHIQARLCYPSGIESLEGPARFFRPFREESQL